MNLDEITQAVLDRGYDTSGTDSPVVDQVREYIWSTYRRILGMYRWPFLRASLEINIDPGDSFVLLTDIPDLGHINALYWEEQGVVDPLPWKPYEEFIEYRATASSESRPAYWTREGLTIQFSSAATVASVLTVYYTRTHDIPNTLDEPIFSEMYHDLLVYGALSEMAYRERDWTAADRADQRFNVLLTQMVGEYGVEQQQDAREVGHSNWWSQIGFGA